MDLFIKLSDFYTQNKEMIHLLFALVIYIVGHRQAAIQYAKSKSKTAIFAVEKWAEELLLQSGAQKMDFVVQKEYAKMPGAVRMVINLDKFRELTQKVYNNASASVADQMPKAVAPTSAVNDISK